MLLARSRDLGEIHVAIVGDFVALARLPREERGSGGGHRRPKFRRDPLRTSSTKNLRRILFCILHDFASAWGVALKKSERRGGGRTHGVGYEVTIPVSVYSSLPAAGAEVSLHIHTHVREDALTLFGFMSTADKALFEKLDFRQWHRTETRGSDRAQRPRGARAYLSDSHRRSRSTGQNPRRRQENSRSA